MNGAAFRLVLCLGVVGLYCPPPASAAAPREAGSALAAGQTIIIQGGKELGATRLRHGFLHGVTYAKGKDYSRTVALVSDLKPKSWRLANHHNNVYAFVVGEARLPSALGTEIVITVQDVFNVRNGHDIRISPTCRPSAKNCFSSYDGFKKSWMAVVNAVMKLNAEKRFVADYIEVFGEPTNGHTKLGLSPQQFGDIFRSTHDMVRRYRPNAKIVAPSIVSYQDRFLKAFLSFAVEHDLRVDAVSWHEFQTPESVPAHAREMREVFKSQPKLCNPTCPEIHINEYAPDTQHLVPGYGVGWLYYLERARIDHANRACWDVPRSGSTCWNGFNGMLMPDNVTPQVMYWVYKAYAEMGSSRVASESAMPRTVALASRDDARKEFRILAGRYGQAGASGKVAIELKDYRHDASSASAEITRIQNAGNTMHAMPSRPAPRMESIRVQNNALSIVIDDFRDGDAYSIVVRAGGSGAAR